MPRGEIWLPEELKVLFKVVQDSCDLDILMSSRHANAVEWEPISREIVRYGFRRTWQQCRAKWKALRRAFHLENEHKLLHGTHSDKRPPSYSIMLKMWQKAGRPVFRDQHMLRTRNNHRYTAPRIISTVPVQEVYMDDDDIKPVILDDDFGSSDSNVDSSPLVCATLDHVVLEEDEEDVKPVILHHIPDTSRSDTESSPDKSQELQLLEKLVMQQKEIITRLDYLNHNLVQMANLHYQHLASSADTARNGNQDSAFAENPPASFPPKFMTFSPTTSSESSGYTAYISDPQAPASFITQVPTSGVQPFQIPASYLSPAQHAGTYMSLSHMPSTFYVPATKNSSTFLPTPSLSQSADHMLVNNNARNSAS
ncbi:uncharacterized protein LOC128655848 isoform X2 [Bombina bombina]|uniref:uncharacterized protein LOC128655848 isoform X2 n=1 Tax=Bombina bombina TaxID=8345 RepID=UPI00235ADDE8|nr:uncharacterized protein LOC128655848 isoform X2 [Bombina bombina]